MFIFNKVSHITFWKCRKLDNQVVLDKDNEVMLGFIHSAACLRATNFRIPHDHVTIEMTHLECGKIVPALSTTTGIVVGYMIQELIKHKMGVPDEQLKELQLSLVSPSVSSYTPPPPQFKQLNSNIPALIRFMVPEIPTPTADGSMDQDGYYTSWFKYNFPGDVTVKELYEFCQNYYQ